MSRKTMGIRALGLSLLAIAGLMAFMAASASANWLVEGNQITSAKLVEASAHTEANLLIRNETDTATELEILCSTVAANDILLVAESTKATGKANFTVCKTWQNGVNVTANCKPEEPIEAAGRAILILHNSKNYVLFEPAEGSTKFGIIKFLAPCALPETNNVKGSLAVECGQLEAGAFVFKDCAETAVSHLVRQNTALFPTDQLTYGTRKASIDGIAKVELSTHESWAGHV